MTVSESIVAVVQKRARRTKQLLKVSPDAEEPVPRREAAGDGDGAAPPFKAPTTRKSLDGGGTPPARWRAVGHRVRLGIEQGGNARWRGRLTILALLALTVAHGACRRATTPAMQAASRQHERGDAFPTAIGGSPAAVLAASAGGSTQLPRVAAQTDVPQSAAAMARERAARAIDRATIARLDPSGPRDAAAPPTSDRWAGLRVVLGTERPLDESARSAFAAWLRAGGGFDDEIVRRCARGHVVGFLLFVRTPEGGERRTDVAVDFTCNSILVVSDAEGRRTTTSAFFDASRAELLALVRRALPLDKGLARLR